MGIKCKGKEKKCGQFADDMWVAIHVTQGSFDEVFRTFNSFSKISGLEINYNKTEILRIGSLQDSEAQMYSLKPLKWSDSIKILGIHLSAKRQIMLQKNFNELYEKMEKILNPWKARTLSLIGKIQVINGLVASTAVYKFLCICLPSQDWLKKCKKLFTNFLWENKKAMIAYKNLIKDIPRGGLKLADLEGKELALKTSWVKKVLQGTDRMWVQLVSEMLPIPLDSMLETSINEGDIMKLGLAKNSVAQTILIAWARVQKITAKGDRSNEQIYDECLWFNSNIRKNGRPFIIRKIFNAGIKQIRDIYDTAACKFYTYQELCYSFGEYR